jgi:hypothetical protein
MTMREFDALCLPPFRDYTPEEMQRFCDNDMRKNKDLERDEQI